MHFSPIYLNATWQSEKARLQYEKDQAAREKARRMQEDLAENRRKMVCAASSFLSHLSSLFLTFTLSLGVLHSIIYIYIYICIIHSIQIEDAWLLQAEEAQKRLEEQDDKRQDRSEQDKHFRSTKTSVAVRYVGVIKSDIDNQE